METQNFAPTLNPSFASPANDSNHEWSTRKQRIQSTWCSSTRRERRNIAASMQELIGTLLAIENQNANS